MNHFREQISYIWWTYILCCVQSMLVSIMDEVGDSIKFCPCQTHLRLLFWCSQYLLLYRTFYLYQIHSPSSFWVELPEEKSHCSYWKSAQLLIFGKCWVLWKTVLSGWGRSFAGLRHARSPYRPDKSSTDLPLQYSAEVQSEPVKFPTTAWKQTLLLFFFSTPYSNKTTFWVTFSLFS